MDNAQRTWDMVWKRPSIRLSVCVCVCSLVLLSEEGDACLCGGHDDSRV